MREIEEIWEDYELAASRGDGSIDAAERLVQDIHPLLSTLAEKECARVNFEWASAARAKTDGERINSLTTVLAEKDTEIERLQLAARRFSRKIAGLPE